MPIHREHLVRAENDADRCNGIIAGRRQCNMKKIPESKFCILHGGNKTLERQKKKALYDFRLDQYNARFAELSDSSSIKNLRDEIAVLRFLVQKRFNTIQNTSDMLNHSSQIARLIKSIASLGESCAKIENQLTDVMDKQSATDIVAQILNTFVVVPDSLWEEIVVLLGRFGRAERSSPSQLKTRWSEEMGTYLTNERVISIRGEIGVLRMLLEERLNACNNDFDLVLNSAVILDVIQDIEKLVLSCHRLEAAQGILLTPVQAQTFGSELLTIVGAHCTPEEMLKISEGMSSNPE